jgi:hypothetical protein
LLHERKKKKEKENQQKEGLHPHNRHTPSISLKQADEMGGGGSFNNGEFVVAPNFAKWSAHLLPSLRVWSITTFQALLLN